MEGKMGCFIIFFFYLSYWRSDSVISKAFLGYATKKTIVNKIKPPKNTHKKPNLLQPPQHISPHNSIHPPHRNSTIFHIIFHNVPLIFATTLVLFRVSQVETCEKGGKGDVFVFDVGWWVVGFRYLGVGISYFCFFDGGFFWV